MPVESHSTPLTGAPRRKNGRQQACEPCRRRKVACDHRLPVCSRCRHGEAPEKCVYITQGSRRHSNHQAVSPRTREVPSLRPQIREASHTPPRTESGNIGYLGMTSFSAFYQEAQNSLQVTEKHEPVSERCSEVKQLDALPGVDELALSILRQIPDQASSQLLYELYTSFNDGWCPLAGKILCESLWTSFGANLEGSRDDTALTRMAVKICENSSVQLEETYEGAKDWVDSYSGPNLRWESLGHLFAYWANGARRLPDRKIIAKECELLQTVNPHDLARSFRICARKCIELSRDASNGNLLLAFLVFKHSLMESNVSGDAGLQYWRTHGDVAALTTFLGLHASPHANPTDISMATQIKRRLFAAIFVHDKTTATFSGRPPFLSRRFSSTPLPLDISDELLLAHPPPTTLQDVNVDENGWNTDGRIDGTTILRARTMLAYVRDVILEMTTQGSDYGGKTALLDLKKREMNIISEFPSFLIYRTEDLQDTNVSGRSLYGKLLVWLEHLQNLFFIERLLSKNQGEETGPRLFEISLEMVSLAHLFWTHQMRLATVEDCVEWMIVSYAAPAGGVLCMELLKGISPGSSMPASKKAVIVEKLGMLASFLDWVEPTAPNADICYTVKKVVRRVIEQAFEPPAPLGMDDPSSLWNMELTADMNSLFNFDLLDTFDWLRPDGGV